MKIFFRQFQLLRRKFTINCSIALEVDTNENEYRFRAKG
jgi:hypothetical protein